MGHVSGNSYYVREFSTINTNIWYHIVGVTNSTNFVMYINGENIDSLQNGGKTDSKNKDFYVGGSGSGSNPRRMNGYLSDLRIYNRPLKYREVNNLYHTGHI